MSETFEPGPKSPDLRADCAGRPLAELSLGNAETGAFLEAEDEIRGRAVWHRLRLCTLPNLDPFSSHRPVASLACSSSKLSEERGQIPETRLSLFQVVLVIPSEEPPPAPSGLQVTELRGWADQEPRLPWDLAVRLEGFRGPKAEAAATRLLSHEGWSSALEAGRLTEACERRQPK
jgi:hypothetical protein